MLTPGPRPGPLRSSWSPSPTGCSNTPVTKETTRCATSLVVPARMNDEPPKLMRVGGLMHNRRTACLAASVALLVASAVILAGEPRQQSATVPTASPSPDRATLDKYCVTCHKRPGAGTC